MVEDEREKQEAEKKSYCYIVLECENPPIIFWKNIPSSQYLPNSNILLPVGRWGFKLETRD